MLNVQKLYIQPTHTHKLDLKSLFIEFQKIIGFQKIFVLLLGGILTACGGDGGAKKDTELPKISVVTFTSSGSSNGLGISSDDKYILGYDTISDSRKAVYWVRETGTKTVLSSSSGNSAANAVSSNGKYIVGHENAKAVVWTRNYLE